MNINGKRIKDLIVLDVLNVNGFQINYIEQNARRMHNLYRRIFRH